MGKQLTQCDYDSIAHQSIFTKSNCEISRATGISESAVSRTLIAIDIVKRGDWEKAKEMINKGSSLHVFQWACKKAKIPLPEEVEKTYYDRMEEKAKARYLNKVKPFEQFTIDDDVNDNEEAVSEYGSFSEVLLHPGQNIIYSRIIEHYTPRNQVIKAIEELSELTVELAKGLSSLNEKDQIIEEIADVLVMLEQLMIIYNCESKVEEIMQQKIARQLSRMASEGA